MNLKIIDFGFATNKNIKSLDTFLGTRTYIAPEIKKRQVYDGTKADLFSTAVIIFVLVCGIFPFRQASETDMFYNMIMKGEMTEYWDLVGGDDLS